jgi:membrane protease YdiL (CAAX protease family)
MSVLLTVVIMYFYMNCDRFIPLTISDNQVLSLRLSAVKFVLGTVCILVTAGLGYSSWRSLQLKNLKKSLNILLPVIVVVVVEFLVIFFRSIKNVTLDGMLMYVIGLLAIGFFEEMLFRYAVLQMLLSKWHSTTKQLELSSAISGLLFGATHLVNIISGNASLYVYGQAVMAAFLGYLLSILYIITKNIWGCVIFHALFDSVSMFGLCFGEEKVQSAISTVQYSLNNASEDKIKQILIVAAFYFFILLFSVVVYRTGHLLLTYSERLRAAEERTKTDEYLMELLHHEDYPFDEGKWAYVTKEKD